MISVPFILFTGVFVVVCSLSFPLFDLSQFSPQSFCLPFTFIPPIITTPSCPRTARNRTARKRRNALQKRKKHLSNKHTTPYSLPPPPSVSPPDPASTLHSHASLPPSGSDCSRSADPVRPPAPPTAVATTGCGRSGTSRCSCSPCCYASRPHPIATSA